MVIDPAAGAVLDPSTQTIVGRSKPFWGERLLWALPMTQSGLQRYLPSHPAAEVCNFGMDFSFVVPFGVGLDSGTVAVFTNTANPAASSDFTIGPVEPRGRALYAQLAGGVNGTDYQLRWTAYDNQGNIWPRVGLLLCALTS